MTTNELIITKVDNKQTLIILTQEEYERKTKAFIQDYQLATMNNNPTQCY
jgi:hypothetical protein